MTRRSPLRLFAWLFAALALLLAPRTASAFGSVKVEGGTTLKEADGRWKLKLVVDYGSLPDINFVPTLFSFQMQTLYERSLTDEGGDKPVITKKSLQNQQPIIESMDIGFSDGTGKTFKITKFNFVIRRDRGFEAGEYTLQLKRTDDGANIGQKIRVILEGDNPIVDRRSISFVGGKEPKKEEKKEAPKEASPSGEGDAPAGNDTPSDLPPSDAAPVDAPPPVEPKQGGCGCRVAGEPSDRTHTSGLGVALGLGLVGAVGLRRRRQSSARRSRSSELGSTP
jgi:MYXO-CTERM domain-containing protein